MEELQLRMVDITQARAYADVFFWYQLDSNVLCHEL